MIEYVTIDQAAELDAFVLQQPNCHFMQTSAWGRVKEGWGWTGILCRDEKGEIIGSMAILEHRIRHMHTGFLYAPRGPIFRDGDYATLEALVDAMRALAEKRGDYMIRIDPMLEETDTAFLDEVRRLGFTVNQASDFSLFQPRMCYVLDLQGFTPESLLAYYNKTKRYDIRRAERNGVTVRLGDVSDIPVFYRMMLATAAKNGFTARPQQYYAHFLEALGPMAKLYLAEKDGVIIAASITAELGNRVWHMYACSDRDPVADAARRARGRLPLLRLPRRRGLSRAGESLLRPASLQAGLRRTVPRLCRPVRPRAAPDAREARPYPAENICTRVISNYLLVSVFPLYKIRKIRYNNFG